MKQHSIYLTARQSEWLQNQPRTFKLSTKIREIFDTWMGTEHEVETNDNCKTKN